MKVEIGTVLSFNESGFVMAMRAWDRLLIPINEALSFYNDFGIGLANKEIYDHIVNDRIEALRTKYRAAIEKQMTRSKLSIGAMIDDASATADRQILTLKSKIEKITEVRNGLQSDQLNFDYIVIATGLAVLSKDGEKKIRDHFSVKIENEKQVEFCALVDKLSEAYSSVRVFYNENSNSRLSETDEMIGNFHTSIMTEIEGKLVIDNDFLTTIGVETNDILPKPRIQKAVTEGELLASTEEELAAVKERGPRLGDPDTHLVTTW